MRTTASGCTLRIRCRSESIAWSGRPTGRWCDLIDEQVGRLLEALEATGQLENTIVIFTSDHGELLGDHGLYLKGPFFYEPSIRVPLIVAGPGVRSGARSPALVELADLAPTLLDAAGLERHPGMQSRSLWPLLSGQASLDRHREDVYCEYYNALDLAPRSYGAGDDGARRAIQAGRDARVGDRANCTIWRRIPAETRNLWDAPEAQGIKLAMFQRLCDRMAWTVDPLPEREGPW